MKKLIITVFALALLVYSCGGGEEKTGTTQQPAQQETAAKPDGSKAFQLYCSACHGAFGDAQINGAKDLGLSQLTVEERIQVITNGREGTTMVGFGDRLSPEEIAAIAEHTLTFAED
jgi:mono/diheme cytochrome c family protein